MENKYDEIRAQVCKEMTSNGLLLGASIQIANMAATIQLLQDRVDSLLYTNNQ